MSNLIRALLQPMNGRGFSEFSVTRQIKQRQRNQEWYEFLMEKRNALMLRLRLSGVVASRNSYGSLAAGDAGDAGDIDDGYGLPELDTDGGLVDADAGQGRPGSRINAASPSEALHLSTSSSAVSPLISFTPPQSNSAYDPPTPYPYGLAGPPPQAAQNGHEEGGYTPAITGVRYGEATPHPLSSDPPPYAVGERENSYALAESPLLQHVEPSAGLHGVDKSPPLRYIKGPGGATFVIPDSPHLYSRSPSIAVSQPIEGAIECKEEAAVRDFASLAPSPAPSYVSGRDDWATGIDYSGASKTREDSK